MASGIFHESTETKSTEMAVESRASTLDMHPSLRCRGPGFLWIEWTEHFPPPKRHSTQQKDLPWGPCSSNVSEDVDCLMRYEAQMLCDVGVELIEYRGEDEDGFATLTQLGC